MPDYYAMYDKLLERAAHPKTPLAEAAACRAKATEIMEKHLQNSNRSFTVYDTKITSRDGRPWQAAAPGAVNFATNDYWAEYMARLAANQWQWNTEYYDKEGKPRPQEEDIVEEEYRYDKEEGDY
jgi:hypothetical protein